MIDYTIRFKLGAVSEDGVWAEINILHEGKSAHVTLVDEYPKENKWEMNPAYLGKHEALHLFLGRLSSLASMRFLSERELIDTEEGAVKILEDLL